MRPKREIARNNGQTYFVTSNTAGRTPLFRHARWAELFIETMYSYRPERYLIHSFTVMPEHFHLLMTPNESLERAVQCLKGGFSFRAKRMFSWSGEIWATGFSDHRIRDSEDISIHQRYIWRNPVKAKLAEREEEYAYCSAGGRFEVDAFPPGLKPGFVAGAVGAAEAAPFQSKDESARGVPRVQSKDESTSGVSRFQSKDESISGVSPFQSSMERR
jgi:putative transposase